MKIKLKVVRMPLPAQTFDLNGLVEHASAFVRQTFAKQGSVAPMWVAFNAATRFVLTCDFSDKNLAVEAVHDFFVKNKVTAYFFVNEAWLLDRTKTGIAISDQEFAAIDARGLKEHPDRREVVMIAAETKAGIVLGKHYILRPEHGKPSLSPLNTDFAELGAEMAGRMVGLLPP